jgi:hypothetical protein
LNGPDCRLLYSNSRILVISSFSKEKKDNVNTELKQMGADVVYFINISPTNSMLDVIDINAFVDSVDIVLIAAGIGSSNILVQCQPLNAICIDAGFCLECLADSTIRSSRVFCLPE